MSDVLVELADITIRYLEGQQARTVVGGFSLELRPGEFVCLSGRSGSGKSSVIRVAAGLQPPTSGMVSWDGTDLAGLDADGLADLRRAQVAYLGQDAPLIDHLRTDDNVLLSRLSGRVSATDREAARAMLDAVELRDRANAKARLLSGGERQRAALARALFCDCRVLMVDEPTSSLDRGNARRVVDLLHERAQGENAVLAASHDADVLARADRVIDIESLASH